MLFIPVPIPGYIFGALYLLVSAWFDRRGGGQINHSAHIWGALYGIAFTLAVGYGNGYNLIERAIDAIRR